MREGFISKGVKGHIKGLGWILYSLLGQKNQNQDQWRETPDKWEAGLAPGKQYSLLTALWLQASPRLRNFLQQTQDTSTSCTSCFQRLVFFLFVQMLRNVLSGRSSPVFGVGFKHTHKCFLQFRHRLQDRATQCLTQWPWAEHSEPFLLPGAGVRVHTRAGTLCSAWGCVGRALQASLYKPGREKPDICREGPWQMTPV